MRTSRGKSAAAVLEKYMDVTREHLTWIDTARGIAIILVVYGHMIGLNTFAFRFIFAFHMPLFFFVSGYCTGESLADRRFLPFLWRKTWTLLIPCWIYTNVLFLITAGPSEFITRISANPFFNIIPVNEWFLPALFLSSIFLWVFSHAEKHAGSARAKTLFWLFSFVLAMFLAEAGVASQFFDIFHPYLPFRFDQALICFCFQSSGYWARNRLPEITSFRLKPTAESVAVFGAAGAACLMYTYFNSYVNICNHAYGRNYILFFAVAFYFIFLLLLLSKWITKKTKYLYSFFAFWGANSLFVYIGQGMLFACRAKLLAFYESVPYMLNPFWIQTARLLSMPFWGDLGFFICIFLFLFPLMLIRMRIAGLFKRSRLT